MPEQPSSSTGTPHITLNGRHDGSMAPPTTPHRARKKQKASPAFSNSPRDNAVVIHQETNNPKPAFPLVAFFWPARKATSQWIILPLVLMIVGLFRWCAGLWGYSGFQTPPMHGDYEAQRHWMEITTHLSMSQWYFYDLEYWGLDYPPLTAYHSWILGKIGSLINPAWFALTSSRGIEQQLLKVYMRATVIISEYLVYMPAAIILNRKIGLLQGVNKWESSIALGAILMQPATILIDHAHFQYNTVMLGFVLASIASLLSEKFAWGCVFFVAALSFKQMALYFAPAMAAYLLGVCVDPKARPLRFLSIVLTTVMCFAMVLAPMSLGALYDNYRNINPPLSTKDRQLNPLLATLTPYIDTSSIYYPLLLQLTQILHRVFPFARGLFEDKVANLWGCIHLIHKLHNYPIPLLQRVSLFATIGAILPACMLISHFPRRELLPWALASSAWGFFLCSFQVHEKSILLPLLPVTILLGGEGGLGGDMRSWIGFANMVGVWTLSPLLKRDELRVPYAVLSLLWAYLLSLPPTSLSCYFGPQATKAAITTITNTLHLSFYATMIIWHIAEAFVEPPKSKPDLFVVLNVLIGAAGSGVCYLWCTWQLIQRSGVMAEYSGFRQSQEGKSLEERAKALPLPWPLGKARERDRRERVSKSPSSSPAPGRRSEKKKVGRPRKKA